MTQEPLSISVRVRFLFVRSVVTLILVPARKLPKLKLYSRLLRVRTTGGLSGWSGGSGCCNWALTSSYAWTGG